MHKAIVALGALSYAYGVLRHSVLVSIFLSSATIASMIGCGDARPPVTDNEAIESGDNPLVHSGDDDQLGPVICRPFTQRPCLQVYIDRNGTRICQPSFSICWHDGRHWTGCGELDAGMPGTPDDDDAGAEASEDGGVNGNGKGKGNGAQNSGGQNHGGQGNGAQGVGAGQNNGNGVQGVGAGQGNGRGKDAGAE